MALRILIALLLYSVAHAQLISRASLTAALLKPAASGGGGGIAVDSTVVEILNPSGPSATGNVTITAGRTIIVGIAGFSGSDVNHKVSTKEFGTNGWRKAETDGSGAGPAGSIWYMTNAPSGITVITNDAGSGAAAMTSFVITVSGLDATAPFTSTEHAQQDFAASNNPRTVSLNNGTASSIYFALVCSDGTTDPQTFTLNSTGTSGGGTWAHAGSGQQSVETSQANFPASMPYVIVSTSAARVHGWTIPDSASGVVLVAAFH